MNKIMFFFYLLCQASKLGKRVIYRKFLLTHIICWLSAPQFPKLSIDPYKKIRNFYFLIIFKSSSGSLVVMKSIFWSINHCNNLGSFTVQALMVNPFSFAEAIHEGFF